MQKILEVRLEKVRMLREWPTLIKRGADAAGRRLGKVEVCLFGSVAEKRWDGSSDLHVLIISDSSPETNLGRSDLKAEIEEEAGLPPIHPLEIHLATRTEADWYFKHAEKMVKVFEE